MGNPVRVLVYYRTAPDQAAAVEQGYHAISQQIAGAPGLLRNELLRSVSDESSLVVFSEWESLEAFSVWSSRAEHRNITSSLRPYADTESGRASFAVYEMIGCYESVSPT